MSEVPKGHQSAFRKALSVFRKKIPVKENEQSAGQNSFSPEAREALEKLGYRIYPLTGKSLSELKREGIEVFSSTSNTEEPEIWELPSRRMDVAINPNKPFLSGSEHLYYDEQEKAVSRFSQGLGIKGAKAIIGAAPDYIELASVYHESSGQYLLGDSDKSVRIRTSTPAKLSEDSRHEATIVVDLNHYGYNPGNRRVHYDTLYPKFKVDSSGSEQIMPLIIPDPK